MVKQYVAVVIWLLLSGCGESKPFYLYYQAQFDNTHVEHVEKLMARIASDWTLRLFAKEKSHMKIISRSDNAFYIALYQKDNVILTIGNAGAGDRLSLGVFDHEELSLLLLERLVGEVKTTLEQQLDMEFELKIKQGQRIAE